MNDYVIIQKMLLATSQIYMVITDEDYNYFLKSDSFRADFYLCNFGKFNTYEEAIAFLENKGCSAILYDLTKYYRNIINTQTNAAKFAAYSENLGGWYLCKTCREFTWICPGKFFEGPKYPEQNKGDDMYCIYSTDYTPEKNIIGIAVYFYDLEFINSHIDIYKFIDMHYMDLESIFHLNKDDIFRCITSYVKHIKKVNDYYHHLNPEEDLESYNFNK